MSVFDPRPVLPSGPEGRSEAMIHLAKSLWVALATVVVGIGLMFLLITGGARRVGSFEGIPVYVARGWLLRVVPEFWQGVSGPAWMLIIDEGVDELTDLLRHERFHVLEHWGRWGVLYPFRWLWLLARHGYADHPDEIEARAAEAIAP